MVTTPTTDTGAYQSLSDLRERVDYRGGDFFDDNAELRYDQLLVRLEREARGIFETLWGDDTPAEETDRTDVMRATDDAAMPLVYPVQDVTQVEYKRTPASDYETLDSDRYDHSEHRLVLADRRRYGAESGRRGNVLAETAMRPEWSDLASKVRVTYDRGFDPVPGDIKSLQVQLVNQMLRKLKREQTVGAASPEELAGMTNQAEVVTEEIRERVSDVASPGRGTMSV